MRFFEIGRVLKPQGVRGEVKLKLYTQNPERVRAGAKLYFGQEGEPVYVASSRVAGEFAYIALSGVTSREEAEKLRGKPVYCERTEKAPPEGGYYVCDLVGLLVETKEGEQMGTLKDVLQYGAADVYVVEGPRGFSFPALKRVISCVDLERGVLTVDGEALSEVLVYDD